MRRVCRRRLHLPRQTRRNARRATMRTKTAREQLEQNTPCGLNSPRPRRFPPSTRAGNSALPPPPPEGAPPSTTRERKCLAASAPSAPRSARGWRRSSAAVAGRGACLAAVSLRLSVSPSLRAPFVRRSYVAIRREGALRSVVPPFLFRPCSSARHDSLPLLPPPADYLSPCGLYSARRVFYVPLRVPLSGARLNHIRLLLSAPGCRV
jgi:hypothetical protein